MNKLPETYLIYLLSRLHSRTTALIVKRAADSFAMIRMRWVGAESQLMLNLVKEAL